MFVDFDFIETYKIPLMAGRNFSEEYGTDTSGAIILNEHSFLFIFEPGNNFVGGVDGGLFEITFPGAFL